MTSEEDDVALNMRWQFSGSFVVEDTSINIAAMKAKTFLLLHSCLLISGNMFGQGSVVLDAGPSFSNVSTDFSPYTYSNNIRVSGNFGAGYRYRVSEYFSLQASIMSEQKGFVWNADIILTDNIGNQLGKQTLDVSFDFGYLSVPVAAIANSKGNIYGLAKLGVVPSYLISAIARQSSIRDPSSGSELYPAHDTDLTKHYDQWDLGGLAGLGIGRHFGNRWTTELTAEYVHGFLSMGNANILQGHYLRNRSAALLFSLAYALGTQATK
jgi:hypothetical protein